MRFIAFGILAAIAGVARADTLMLNNGAQYNGSIVKESDAEVTILSDGAQWTFPKTKITRLTHDEASSAAAAEKTRQQQLEREQHDRAAAEHAREVKAREDEKRQKFQESNVPAEQAAPQPSILDPGGPPVAPDGSGGIATGAVVLKSTSKPKPATTKATASAPQAPVTKK